MKLFGLIYPRVLVFGLLLLSFVSHAQPGGPGGGPPGNPQDLPPNYGPSNLVASTISAYRIDISWTDNDSNEDIFQIERSLFADSGFSSIASLESNSTSFSDVGLTPLTAYYYRVRAVNPFGESPYSNVSSATTFPELPPVSGPNNLVATGVSASEIELTWVENAFNEDSVEVERSLSGVSGFAKIAALPRNTTSYTDGGLSLGVQYFYRVRLVNEFGSSPYSNIDSAVTINTLPPDAAPTGLTALAISESQIDLSWLENSSNEDSVEVERSLYLDSAFVKIASLPANSNSYSDLGLTSATEYFYRVRLMNAIGVSAYSNVDSAITASATPPDAVPYGLVATAFSQTQIDLTWIENATNEDSVEVERSLFPDAGFLIVVSLPANSTSYSDTGLSSDTQYFYRVRTTNAYGSSQYSNIDSATTAGNQPPIGSPNLLSAFALSGSQIDLSWIDEVVNEDSIEVERSLLSNSGFLKVSTLPANSVSYSDTGLNSGTQYFYRVRGINGFGAGPYSSVDSATTHSIPDLTVSGSGISQDTIKNGFSIDVQSLVVNIGSGVSPASKLSVYLSDNDSLEADIVLQQFDIASLNADSSSQVSGNIVIPPGTSAGSYFVLFAVDVVGAIAELSEENNIEAVPLTVIQNSAPQITAQLPNPFVLNEDDSLVLSLSNFEFTDPDDTDGFALQVLAGTNYTVNNNTITPVLNFNGQLLVNVSVSDSLGGVSETFAAAATVLPVNDPPTIDNQTPNPFVVDMNQNLVLSVSNFVITDVDNSSGFNIELLPGSNYTFTDTTVTPALDFSGALVVNVQAIDSAGVTSLVFPASVTVNNTNVTPVIVGITDGPFQMNTSGTRRAQPVTVSETGMLQSITMYHWAGSGNMILAVYDDNSGLPGTRIGVTPTTPIANSTDWQTIELSIPVQVVAGQTIWLAWVYQTNPGISTKSGTPGRAATSQTWSGGMPLQFGSSSIANNIYSIYATILPQPPAPLNAPTGLGAVANNDLTIDLSWVDTNSQEDSVLVERSTISDSSGFVQIASLGANSTSYHDSGLGLGITYYYRVRTSNAFSYSPYSNVASASTPSEVLLPDFTIYNTSLSSSTVSSGSQVGALWNIENLGDLDSPSSNVSVYLSTDQVIGNDVLVATFGISPLIPGGIIPGSGDILIPINTSAGSYYLAFVVDADNLVGEESEGNNVSFVSLDVTNDVQPVIIGITDGPFQQNTSNTRRAQPVIVTEDGFLTSISMYHWAGNGNWILAVYDDNNGFPNNRIGVTPVTQLDNATGWQTVELESPAQVASGQQIWLAWVFESNPGISTRSGTPGRAATSQGWSGGMPALFGGSSLANNIYSIYATVLPAAPEPLIEPSALTATAQADLTIDITWNEPNSTEESIELERSLSPDNGFTLLATLPANTEFYTDQGLSENTTYYYRARSRNLYGSSPYSNVDSATTGTAPALPDFVVNSPTLSSSQVSSGDELSASVTVHNLGDTIAPPAKVSFFLSTESVLTNPVLLFEFDLPALGSGLSAIVNGNITIPQSTPTGNYYVVFVADYYSSVAEMSEGNNAQSMAIGVTNNFTPVIAGITDGPFAMNTSNTRRAQPVTIPETGTIQSISMYHWAGGGNMLLAVYENNNGAPGARLGITPVTAVANATDWQTVQLEQPVAVQAGDLVWLAWVFENNPGISTKSGTPGRAATTQNWSGGMPATFGSASFANNIYSIYATILPSGNNQGNLRVGETQSQSPENMETDFAIDMKAFPNPFREAITVEFNVYQEQAHTKLSLYDQLGRNLVDIVNEVLPKGNYSFTLNTSESANPVTDPGLYIIRLEVDSETVIRRVIKQ